MSARYQDADVFTSERFEEVRRFVTGELEASVDSGKGLESFERELRQHMQAVEAQIVKEYVSRYDIDSERIEVGGEKFRRKGRVEKEYHALSGTFVVERTIYVPCHGPGRAIVPLELRAGMVEGTWTPLLARVMARTVASTTPKEAAEIFVEFAGTVPSTSSLDRLPKQLSEMWEMQREVFEEELRSQVSVPAAATSVAISIDGVQVPMKDGGRSAKRSQEDKRPQGPAGYREVGCATLTFYDGDGERLETVRYARMPEAKKATLKRQLESELESVLAVSPELTVVALADGAEDNWTYLRGLRDRLGIEDFEEAEDIFHVLEHVKEALDAYHGDGTAEAKAAFEEARIWLRETADGAERVLRALRYRRDRRSGAKRTKIAAVVRYLQKRRHRLRYKDLLDRGLPIGSGVVEAACKTLASERMKRSGMSWREEGGQAILTFRSLLQSERWDRGWALLAAQYRLPPDEFKIAA